MVSGQIVDSAIAVHSALGPGLLEGAYAACLRHELVSRGLKVDQEVSLPVVYKGVTIDLGYRLDMIVEDLVVVELKATDTIAPIHQAQLLSYLRLSGKQVGLLLNFRVLHMRDGVKRMVNRL